MVLKSTLVILAAAGCAISAPLASLVRRGNLPEPVDAQTALSYLDSISEDAKSNDPAYSRDYFKTWDNQGNHCNTRDVVLKRDGDDVVTNDDCVATSGTWFSDYDAVTVTEERQLDIDHLVPLKEAWISGARSWTDDQRESFANDLDRPQLLSVTAHANRAKGDKDIADWLPRQEFQCEYVRAWVQVKYYYNLSMDSDEKQAATNVLNSC